MLSTDPPLAAAEDMAIPRGVPTADQAIALIREHHARWRALVLVQGELESRCYPEWIGHGDSPMAVADAQPSATSPGADDPLCSA